jgi:hypothetical protein
MVTFCVDDASSQRQSCGAAICGATRTRGQGPEALRSGSGALEPAARDRGAMWRRRDKAHAASRDRPRSRAVPGAVRRVGMRRRTRSDGTRDASAPRETGHLSGQRRLHRIHWTQPVPSRGPLRGRGRVRGPIEDGRRGIAAPSSLGPRCRRRYGRSLAEQTQSSRTCSSKAIPETPCHSVVLTQTLRWSAA